MRIRTLFTVVTLVLLSGLCFAAEVPVAALGVPVVALNIPSSSDFSLSSMLVVKDSSNHGIGAKLSSSHYFTRHLGIVAEAEAIDVQSYKLHEYAARLGGIYRFNVATDFQPYVVASAGAANVSALYWGEPHIVSGSMQFEAGSDVRINGPIFARFAGNVVDDWNARTHFISATAGISYHFGNYRGR